MNDNAQAAEQDGGSQSEEAERSVYSCPQCGGPLFEVDAPEGLKFRCYLGHVRTGEELLQDKVEASEASLWATLRTLTEQAKLARRAAEMGRTDGRERLPVRMEELARKADQKAEEIRRLLEMGTETADLLRVESDAARSEQD